MARPKGFKCSEETRKKMSLAKLGKGKPCHPNTAKALGDQVRGKKQTPEQIAKRNASRKATLALKKLSLANSSAVIQGLNSD